MINEIKAGAIKGAIFDLDGTLIDSMGVWERIDREFLRKRNIDPPVGLSQTVKNMTFRKSALYFKSRFNITDSIEEIMAEWNDMADYEYSHKIKLKSGIEEFLSYLKAQDVKIGLATTNYRPLVEKVLKNNGILSFFAAISTKTEVGRGKQFPDIYLATAKKLVLEPGQCVVFEDILPAIIGAKRAGMKVIGVHDESAREEEKEIKEEADAYIYDFTAYP